MRIFDTGRTPVPSRLRGMILTAVTAGAAAVAAGCWGMDDPTTRSPGAPAAPMIDRGMDRPLVGTNYTHRSFADCSWNGHGILRTYWNEAVKEEVDRQLRQMRRSGVESLRHIVWHMRDVARQNWGVVPSRGGRLPQPFRGSLIAYLTEIRRLGFRRLTVSFSPQWSNSPIRDNYDPELFEENWAFIEDVRAIVLEHGPPDVRFDLLNEGAPSDHAPAEQRARMSRYVERIWRRYADAFGVGDATVSIIAPARALDRGHRLENLLEAFAASGAPLPGWFELHLNYHAAGVTWGLRYADSVLTARGLLQPITIGETSYDDASVAEAVRTFLEGTDRPLAEVTQWFRRAGASCEVSPPYEVDAFLILGQPREPHRGDPAPENSSDSSSLASARVSALGRSSSAPSGAGLWPELLIR